MSENSGNMSKGKDFRPRKRGFDDDGPMPYEPRPRSPRGFGPGQENGGRSEERRVGKECV